MRNNQSIISIIMPLYNCENFLKDSIGSIMSQSYQEWELIVVDDNSTDGSYTLAEKLAYSEPRIKLYKMDKNSGIARVRNCALQKASGRYIAFLDSDDVWDKDKLQKQLEFMKKDNLSFSFTAFTPISEDGSKKKRVNHVPSKLTYEGLLKKTAIGCLTVMYDSAKVGKCYFDTSLAKHEDYQCWLEILKTIPYAGGLDESLAYYRLRANSISSNKIVSASYVWKIIYKYQKIPFYKSVYYFSHYALNALRKYKDR